MKIIGDLKKECFGLKMRIYFMEEKLQDAFSGDPEGTIKQVCLKIFFFFKFYIA